MINLKKKCKNCEVVFIAHESKMKFCSKLCCRKFHHKKRDRTLIILKERVCLWCKSKYTPKTNKSVHCSKNCSRYTNMYRYPDKLKTRKLFAYAIQEGFVIRPEYCEECFKNCKPDGHHKDYTKPLEVIWLCRQCHLKHHRELNANIIKKNC